MGRAQRVRQAQPWLAQLRQRARTSFQTARATCSASAHEPRGMRGECRHQWGGARTLDLADATFPGVKRHRVLMLVQLPTPRGAREARRGTRAPPLASHQRSPQYAGWFGSSVTKSNDAQLICVTTSGTMPSDARLAMVDVGLPSISSDASLSSVVFSVCSICAKRAGLLHAVLVELCPAGVRSSATAALHCSQVVTGTPFRSSP